MQGGLDLGLWVVLGRGLCGTPRGLPSVIPPGIKFGISDPVWRCYCPSGIKSRIIDPVWLCDCPRGIKSGIINPVWLCDCPRGIKSGIINPVWQSDPGTFRTTSAPHGTQWPFPCGRSALILETFRACPWDLPRLLLGPSARKRPPSHFCAIILAEGRYHFCGRSPQTLRTFRTASASHGTQ